MAPGHQLPGSFTKRQVIPKEPSHAGPSNPRRDNEDDWEDDDVEAVLASPTMSDISRTTSEASKPTSRTPRTKLASPRRVGKSNNTPTRSRPTPLRPRKPPPRTSDFPTPSRPPRAPPNKSPPWIQAISWSLSLAFNSLLILIRLFHAIFSPFYHYIAIGAAAVLFSSYAVHMFIDRVPSLIFRLLGYPLRSALPSLAWWTPTSDEVTAMGQGMALLPIRSLATPLCALTGQACALSLATKRNSTEIRPAQPFWMWTWGTTSDAVNVGEVARSLAKEATGAKDIFESVARLSDGGIMDRLEYVRIWELGVAVQVGSNLDDKEFLGKGLVDLGNNAKDLSDELVELNAMAVNAFTWLQWEFASVYKVLSQPSSKQPSAQLLSNRLNSLLNRLSDTLADLHRLTTRAHTTATRGSDQGNRLRTHLGQINADLVRQHEIEPGWKMAVEKAQHFLVGGEPSKMALVKRDVKLTRQTIDSLSVIIHDLEISRTMIKSFRDQIGQFDASMMGFHLGASEKNGIGPEEELRVLAEVVGEFGRSIGRAKSSWTGGEERESEARLLEAT